MLKKNILILCLFATFAAATPVGDHGALRVENGAVVDKNGSVVQLRGMSLFWDIWTEGSQYYNAGTISTLANSWKANVVRAAIGGGSTGNAQTIMDAAISNGIYVVVDWHHHDIDASGAKSFFQTVSNYAKSKGGSACSPNVIFEIFNEPKDDQGGTWSAIKSYANEVIPVIRAICPDNLIIVGTPQYSSRVDLAAADPLTGTNAYNVAYTFHFYASEHGPNYRAWVNTAYCKKLPMFITEWGTSPASGDGTIDWDDVATWVDFIENRKLSHINWSISSKSESSSTTPDANSASGQYVKNLISKLNQGQSHGDVTNSPYTCPGDIVVPDQEGGATVGVDTWLEGENYESLENSSAQKVADETALGRKKYLGTLTESDLATYSLTAQKDTLLVIRLTYKSAGGAVVEISDGVHTTQAELSSASSWTLKSVAPVVLHTTGQVTLKVISGSLDLDMIDWRAFYFGDPEADPPTIGDLATWEGVDSWDLSASPIASAGLLSDFSVRVLNGRIVVENAPANAKVQVFDIKGNAVGFEVSRGMYIVKVNNKIQKAVVK